MLPVDIARVLGSARAFNLWSATPVVQTPVPPEDVSDLFAALDKGRANYLLVGGIALLHYVAGRNTEDIDLIVSLEDAGSIHGLQIASHDLDFARARFRSLHVDLRLTSNTLFHHVLDHHGVDAMVGPQAIRVVSAQGLVVLKLFALPSLYRQARFDRVRLYEADLAMLMDARDVDAEAALMELAPHLPDADLSELRRILAELNARIAQRDRFGIDLREQLRGIDTDVEPDDDPA